MPAFMRNSIDLALDSKIPPTYSHLAPIDYLRLLATQLELVKIALDEAEKSEGMMISVAESCRSRIEACRNALYDICNT